MRVSWSKRRCCQRNFSPAYGWFVFPALCYLVVLLLVPTWYAMQLGISLDNFRSLAQDTFFGQAMLNNVFIPLVSMMVEVVAGVGLALFLAQRFPGRRFLRVIALLPFVIPEIVFLTLMRYVFAEHGYINAVLMGMGIDPVFWLAPNSWLARMVVSIVDAWHVTPVVFLIVLARLESLDPALYEAAVLDGAGPWQSFWYLTRPLLMPAVLVAVMLRSVDALRIFTTPFVLLGFEGMPVLSSYAYHQWAVQNRWDLACASALVLGGVVLIFSFGYFFWWHRVDRYA